MSNILNDIKVSPSLVFMDIFDETDKKIIEKLSTHLFNQGLVKKSYIQAILKREEVFPTGLQCEDIGVAIPHTDPEHVLTQSIAIGILKEPVLFRQMGSNDIEVPVQIVLMLAVKEPQKQIGFLQELMGLLQQKKTFITLLGCKSQQEAVDKFNDFFEKRK
ncbi:PTS sugar transporter subunit IIA [Irregularibacter muris]|uniref:PTS sugar transporter subunit IIA n=1 Tax=Irregularibacter muris TaxID=1796619 RepID=A0AAE3HFX3_9FIRM|nr:PTS sugar transporter subunit IIA [Irregularibacter muris]MCR1898704.1 PTS sugar transporter subunit IIA [Irregularibacter muris]